MLTKQLETNVTETTTDEGFFTAIAAAYSIDRTKEQIVKGAFSQTIENWRSSGKEIPVHWDHDRAAHNVIGHVDPGQMNETPQGLYVAGWLDLEDSAVAREAWRSMKNNAVALSFGYMVTDSQKRGDGVLELRGIDLFEVTITPSPANPDTRVLSMKSMRSIQIATFEL